MKGSFYTHYHQRLDFYTTTTINLMIHSCFSMREKDTTTQPTSHECKGKTSNHFYKQ